MKVILIEDEENTRKALKKMLQIVMPTIEIIGESAFVELGAKLIQSLKPDCVFLDIELEDGTGFDLLNKLESIDFKLVFTTAYNNFAIKAFKYSAMDYLLKPINPEELQLTLFKIQKLVDTENEQKQMLEILQNNLQNEKEKKIILRTTDQRYVLPINEIIRLEADGAYTKFVSLNKNILTSKNLKYYENLLPKEFIRSHQSHLVNSKYIKSLDKSGNLYLSNNECIPVSYRKRKEINQILFKE